MGPFDKFLGRGFWTSLLLGVLACAFPALTQPQQISVISIPNAATSVAQENAELPGMISGTVMDGSGAVVVGAHVTLIEGEQSAIQQEELSGTNGEFSFTNITPGSFQIRIAATGFATQTSTGVLHSGEVYFAPAKPLTPAAVGTEVEVTVPRIEVAVAEFKAEEQQRFLGVVPNFYVAYVADAAPLTAKQKWELAWKSSIDPVNVAMTGLAAGAEQAQNQFGGYGQGAQGYAKRFGANYTDAATSTFIGSALLPVVLKQDPRYFYKGTGSKKSRILYAMANAVVCKGDNGHWQANYSAILGGLASGGISNLYYPPQDRGASLVFENTMIGTGETAIFNIFEEFFSRRLTSHIPKDSPDKH